MKFQKEHDLLILKNVYLDMRGNYVVFKYLVRKFLKLKDYDTALYYQSLATHQLSAVNHMWQYLNLYIK